MVTAHPVATTVRANPTPGITATAVRMQAIISGMHSVDRTILREQKDLAAVLPHRADLPAVLQVVAAAMQAQEKLIWRSPEDILEIGSQRSPILMMLE